MLYMEINADFNRIKNGVISAYHQGANKACEWVGRGIRVLKSGTEAASPYLQDKRIAFVSLIALNLLLIELTNLLSLSLRFLPNRTDGQKTIADIIDVSLGLGIIAGGVTLFVRYTKLPLSLTTLTVTTIATVILRAIAY